MMNFFTLFSNSFTRIGEVITNNFRRDFYRWVLLILTANLLTVLFVASIIYIIEASIANSFTFSFEVLYEYTIRQDFYYFTIQTGLIFNALVGLIIYKNDKRKEKSFKVNLFSKEVNNRIGQALLVAVGFLFFRISVIYLIASSPFVSFNSYFEYLSDDSNLALVGYYAQFLITVISTVVILFFVFRIFVLDESSIKDSLTKDKIPTILVSIVLSFFFFSTLGFARDLIIPFAQLLAFKLGVIGLVFSFFINLFVVVVSTIFIALAISTPFLLTIKPKAVQFISSSTSKRDDLLDSN